MLNVLKGKPLPSIPGERMNRDSCNALILKAIGANTLSIGQISNRIPRIKRPTLKKDLGALVRAGVLKRSGKGKGVLYCQQASD